VETMLGRPVWQVNAQAGAVISLASLGAGPRKGGTFFDLLTYIGDRTLSYGGYWT